MLSPDVSPGLNGSNKKMKTAEKKVARRSTSKLRSGCLTCKDRRIKCDETKPTCLRCSRSHRSCQGYIDPFQYYPAVDVSTPGSYSLLFRNNFSDPLFDSAEEPWTEDELLQDRQSFRHFIAETSVHVPSTLDLAVWTEIIPRLSTTFPAIQYALLALSAQHEVTIRSSHGNKNEMMPAHALRLYSYRQYGKAIQRLNMILIDAVQKYDILLETSFACLLLIVCEILRGSDVAARYHLDGAINLLSIPSVARSQLLLAESRRASCPVGSELLKGLALIFQQLDLQAAAFAGSRLPIGPENVDSITGWYPTLSCPDKNFSGDGTFEELRQSLLSIQVRVSRFIDSETVIRCKYSADSQQSQERKDEFSVVKREQQSLIQQLGKWETNADTVYVEPDYRTRSDLLLEEEQLNFRQHYAQIVLRLSYLTYYILLSTSLSPDEMAYDSHTSLFTHIIDLSETVLQLEQGSLSSNSDTDTSSHFHFCIDMKLIYPLYITALKCRDFTIRHQAVRFLSRCGREGVWDGRMMASIAQRVISCEEECAIVSPEYGQEAIFSEDCIISIPESARIHGVGIVDMDRQRRQLRVVCSRKNETTAVDDEVIWDRILLDVEF